MGAERKWGRRIICNIWRSACSISDELLFFGFVWIKVTCAYGPVQDRRSLAKIAWPGNQVFDSYCSLSGSVSELASYLAFTRLCKNFGISLILIEQKDRVLSSILWEEIFYIDWSNFCRFPFKGETLDATIRRSSLHASI